MLIEAYTTILDFHIYPGAGDVTGGKSLHLMGNYFDHGHPVHMDNYYNYSYNLTNNKVMIGKWRTKRDIIYISTEYKNEMLSGHSI